MSWKCPACQTIIRHVEDPPREGRVYRCHVCRLELMIDPTTSELVLAVLKSDEAQPVEILERPKKR